MLLVTAAACTGAPTPARPTTPSDAGRACTDDWDQLAASTRHGWMSVDAPVWGPQARFDQPVRVVDLDLARNRVEVASVTPHAVVTRWVPVAALGRATTRDVALTGMVIRAGHQLRPATADQMTVHLPPAAREGGVELDGAVPAFVANIVWEEAPREPVWRRHQQWITGELRAAPSADAPVRARMPVPALVVARAATPDGWLAVTAYLPHAEIEGWWLRPPPPPPAPAVISDEAELDLELEPTGPPFVAAMCLRDAPRGRIAGTLLRVTDLVARPAAIAGWYAVDVPTLWGPTTYYIDGPLPVPAPPETWDGEWRFERW